MFLYAKYAFSFISRACCLDCFAGHLRHCYAMSNVIRYNDLTGQPSQHVYTTRSVQRDWEISFIFGTISLQITNL